MSASNERETSMAKKGIQVGLFTAIAVAGFVFLGWATPRAQGLGQASSGQMAELISEVKLMRAALQEMASGQSQMQALGIQLNAQQGRITQVSASLDSANAQLSDVVSRAKDTARELAADQTLFARTPDPNQRATLQQQIADLKQRSTELASEEAQLRSRVSRLTSTLNSEEQRWQTLSSRLDALARK
jgi:chromosome segregation ATPase